MIVLHRQSRSNKDKPLGLCLRRMWLIIAPVACVLVMLFGLSALSPSAISIRAECYFAISAMFKA